MPASSEYREFLQRVKELSTIEQVSNMLGWDEQTYMPAGSYQARAQQNAFMAGLAHERLTSKEMGRLIRALKKQKLSADGEAILRETERKYRRASSIPGDLVREITSVSSLGIDAWMRARKDNNFKELEPLLGKMIGLKARVAEHVGYEGRPYDALLDEYEPYMKSKELDALFLRLGKKLRPIVARIFEEPIPGKVIPAGKYSLDSQRGFIGELCTGMGYDLNCGRVDVSAHPFTMGTGRDVRITVKYDESDPVTSVFPAIHETGHALYEQGLQEKYYGTPLAESVSMGIHESQSRLWENFVGRGLPFWTFYYPSLQRTFPALKKVPLKSFHRGINTVKRSYIRTESDEVTYNLHIMLRYDLELAIFEDKLKVSEIPAYWNERFEHYLGIEVPDDARGCLQDIHWVGGSFGYFPTYALGNIYAAQLWDAARKQVPGLEDRIAAGDLNAMLGWLRANIHRHGRRYGATELIRRATGENINEDHFIGYIKEKYGRIYGIRL
jgi:carboxypeptidase Taq